MTALRTAQARSYWADSTEDSIFRDLFCLPDDEHKLVDVHSVLSVEGDSDNYSGKVYVSESFLAFLSHDRRCRLSLPLATVRKVERLTNQDNLPGAFSLRMTFLNQQRILVQLNGLRSTNDTFCDHLQRQLKQAIPKMKELKTFTRTLYSEWIMNPELFNAGFIKPPIADLISFDDESIKQLAQEQEEAQDWTTRGGIGFQYHGGLGNIFKFPGDPKKLREKSKMKLWTEYLKNHGRNVTLVRYPTFTRLVQVGLPNNLRGEIWELTCGSLYLRLENPGLYFKILEEHKGQKSMATDEIEKDLHRSLPEYAAYQDPRGIDTMRRVLTAYAWNNPEVGYCQAMNIIVASFLIYMSEEQCFWCLSVLCNRLLPGYYSPSMYGTVLDQRVFERLVERCLPQIHNHFTVNDVQLSVATLPWFLSCYISSLPMVFAFRIIDCFFLLGPRVLFQVGLAILKINGEELLSTTDDGAFISIMKSYAASLGEPAHPHSKDKRVRQITKFQQLLVTAFHEFAVITDETIASERKAFRKEVVVSIEDFAKRTALRNLKFVGRLGKHLGLIYDHFQFAILKNRESSLRGGGPLTPNVLAGSTKDGETGRTEVRIDRKIFGTLLGAITTWARDERLVKNGFHEHIQRTAVDHAFIDRIFRFWDRDKVGKLSLQDIVYGLDGVLYNDLMPNLEWIFQVHDADQDGYLTKDEILQLSESLLFIFRNELGDRYLGSVSNLMQNLFEAAENTKPAADGDESTAPYLGLSTFRMCILADPLLEDFFESDLTNSWKLEILIADDQPKAGAMGFVSGLVKGLMTDENMDRVNWLADRLGKGLEIQQVIQRPSIGKLSAEAAAIEPSMRDSLFSTSRAKTPTSEKSTNAPHPLSAAAMRMPAYPSTSVPSTGGIKYDNPWAADELSSRKDIDMNVVARRMERPHFDAGVGGEESDNDNEDGDADHSLLREVDNFLEESGVDAQ